ncbi:hypothetical protein ACP4OV_022220 [Aristida adscensionis]
MDKERERKEGGGAGARRGWGGTPDGVIVLPAGSAARREGRPQEQEEHQHPQRKREREREREQQPAAGRMVGAAAGILGEYPEPPEKALYKTRLCEKFEAEGWCAYEGGCSFAHGAAELRPPASHVVLVGGAARSHPRGAGGGGFYGKVCFEFRDTGACHYGERCTYAHVTAAEAAEMRYHQTVPRVVERSLTPPGRTFSPGSSRGAGGGGGGGGYGPATARAFPAAPAAPAQQGDRKLTRLEILSQKKMSGIYGDWPEQN